VEPKLKSFFERPEGTTGLAFIGAGIALTCIIGYYFLPVVIVILTNIIWASILGAIVCGGIALALNDNVRFLVSSAFQSAMRFITGLFIAIDPIGILKNYLKQMKDRLVKIEKHIIELTGQIRSLESNIINRTENVKNFMKLAKAAKDRGQTDRAGLEANKAAREKDFVDKLTVTLTKMEEVQKILSKMKQNLNYLYEDTEHNITIREAEYNSIQASYKALKGAEALIEGDKAKALFEQAMEYTANDIAEKLGEMDRFMDTSKDFMMTMDLQNAVFNEDGLELLAQWEKNGSAILDYEKNRGKIRVDNTNNSGILSPLEQAQAETEQAEIEANSESQFSSFFNKR
jgi:phage shock protein A